MSYGTEIVSEQRDIDGIHDLSLQNQDKKKKKIHEEINETSFGSHGGCCAICLNEIPLQETAMVKGCEHTYCVTCILRWASYKEIHTCPQCKHPFEFLSVHRALDGSIEYFLFEESVCLLLRASWFVPLDVVEQESYSHDYNDDFDTPCYYGDEDDDLDEFYLHGSSILRIGNRRWGDNGFVRSGHQQARPVHKHSSGTSSSPSSGSSPCEKHVKTTNTTGRRAKRAMKREAANKAAEVASAAKHEAHLVKLGRN